jgi:hypothetical protein
MLCTLYEEISRLFTLAPSYICDTLYQTTPDSSTLWTKSVMKRSETLAVAYISNISPETRFHFIYESTVPWQRRLQGRQNVL